EDVTNTILTTEAKEILFDLFNSKTNITNQDILKNLSFGENQLDTSTYRTNYPPEKEFKGNETKTVFRRVFNRHNYKVEGEKLLQNRDSLNLLWHIVYSLDNEKNIYSAIKNNFNFPEDLTAHISKLPPFKLEYGSLSAKAMSKLLCCMRCGKYFDSNNINADIAERIEKIIDGEVDDTIPLKVREYFNNMKFRRIEDFSGLPPFIAAYLVYGRHSERENSEKFENGSEIKLLEPNTLRNPVVEQITNETLQLVKDIWKSFGRPDEIHIELSRDLKKNASERQKISKQMMQNENDRKRVRAILKELNNANADSPSDMERLRLWEETGNRFAKESLPKFSKEPSKQEIDKYLLWGEQNHISPYTGRVIPLSRLFTSDYEIEHIIPKSRFFDDSFANKTICESKVNKFKDNFTAMELINEYSGYKIPNSEFSLFDIDSYTQHIKATFFGKKRKNFLSDSIPEDFVERQINDTRYIGKKVAELL
ncbi:MAG TPA: HNH endonuclease domain-containing protein, partial [Ignavibacteriaceae bacterium]|nr:HNH endonuclease domain-containing protein [Ignavibacteriaceae bacterium]